MKAARSAGVMFSTGRLMAEAAVRDEGGSRGVRQTIRKLDSIVLAPGNSTKRLTTGLDTTRDSEEFTEQGCNALVGSHVAVGTLHFAGVAGSGASAEGVLWLASSVLVCLTDEYY